LVPAGLRLLGQAGGWALDNPGNNFHYSFLDGTAFAGYARNEVSHEKRLTKRRTGELTQWEKIRPRIQLGKSFRYRYAERLITAPKPSYNQIIFGSFAGSGIRNEAGKIAAVA
jgi:hypothetical protein